MLTRNYNNDDEARNGIATALAGRYPGYWRIRAAIPVVQAIYTNNFFPVMKANWSVYPDNVGHMNLARLFPLPRRQPQDR